jgi:uncharacterized protein YbcV (DUF1398 family)
MASSPKNSVFMPFNVLHSIIEDDNDISNKNDISYIVQLEGGEPLTHKGLYLFLEYLATFKNIERIVIDTNAVLLQKSIDKIVEIAERTQKYIDIKPSYNTYLINKWNNEHKDINQTYDMYLSNIISACEFVEHVNFELNVRGYSYEELDELILFSDTIQKIKVPYNKHLLNAYGKAESLDLPDLVINKVYDNWKCYSTDGYCFEQDLKKRAVYEAKLQDKIPFFNY